MKLITRNDIENWVERNDSKGFFPNLISKLIRATTLPSTQIDFPSGSTVSVGGWDGVVICHAKTAYVPMGKTLWELGTKKNPKAQAEENYVKRTKDSLGHDISKSTFVFVKPTDKALLVAINPEKGEAAYITDGAPRSEKAEDLMVSPYWAGDDVEVYLAFISENGKDVASSSYLGTVTVA